MTVAANRQWRLKRRPSGQFDQADFELATVPIPEMRASGVGTVVK